jgi:DNA-binding SARP family transcriptional activator
MAVETRAQLSPGSVAVEERRLGGGIRLAMLEGFELTSDNCTISLPLNAQRLMAFLALQDRALLRLYIAGVLWPDTPEERSTANLRSTLWRLHRPGYKLVEATGQHLRLAPTVVVDIREMTALARRLLERSIDCEEMVCTRLYLSGELLRDWYDEWVTMERERFRQLRLHALERLCEGLTIAGQFGQAVEAGLAAVAGEPLRETAHRVLIRAYLAEGNGVEAVRQYRRYRQLLWDEVKMRPSSEMDGLVCSLELQ